ncbi:MULTISPECIES: hypothetical protein [unclassified Nocardioides]|uniref:hypothetical protein n=1 Tax=unclassified Nocardioides TaxID=2615069 RepID=UPI0036108821
MKFGLLVMLVLGFGLPPMSASAGTIESPARPTAVTVRGPAEAVEGDRVTFTVRVPKAGRAKNVRLEAQTSDILGNKTWEGVRRTAVLGPKVALRTTVTALNRQRYRAVVTYQDKTVVRSRPFSVKIWRWIPLTAFESYYDTGGIMDEAWWTFAINGLAYKGWGTYTRSTAWESRYTLGRHCTTMSGIFGVTDESADGSSGQVAIKADDKLLHTSPVLVPGSEHKTTLPLGRPYRISVSATNPAASSELYAFPAIGDAEFLCTGL